MTEARLELGTTEWFEMVGQAMCEAASEVSLPDTLTLSLVERYIDGLAFLNGRVQGLRFDLTAGVPSYSVGVLPEEKGDINIEVTMAAARRLNSLISADPAYAEAIEDLSRSGNLRIQGDPLRLGEWITEVHDVIVARTA